MYPYFFIFIDPINEYKYKSDRFTPTGSLKLGGSRISSSSNHVIGYNHIGTYLVFTH